MKYINIRNKTSVADALICQHFTSNKVDKTRSLNSCQNATNPTSPSLHKRNAASIQMLLNNAFNKFSKFHHSLLLVAESFSAMEHIPISSSRFQGGGAERFRQEGRQTIQALGLPL